MKISLRMIALMLSTLLLASCGSSCGGGDSALIEPESPPTADPETEPGDDPAAQQADATDPEGGEETTPPPSESTAVTESRSGADEPTGGTMTDPNPALSDPSLATEQAPASFKARFETTKGDFVVSVNREWSPLGADRFYNLVKIGFFDDIGFFRVMAGFIAQFGIHGDPQISSTWRKANIQDDPVVKGNARGTVVFATAGPGTRTSQLFINLVDNSGGLDGQGFSAFGEITEGMDVVDQLYSGYGEGAPRGRGPNQQLIVTRGNDYLKKEFPRLDFVVKAEIVE